MSDLTNKIAADRIEVGDIVAVNINGSQMTVTHKAEVLSIPCAAGDSWIFKNIPNDLGMNNKTINYVSEGCTVTLLEKGE